MSVDPHSPCFVDTNIWLYAFINGNDPKKSTTARALIAASQPVVSVQVINEVCVNLLKNANFTEDQIRQLVSAFSEKYHIIELDLDILNTASRLREQRILSYWDSMAIACALHSGAKVLYSEVLSPDLIIDQDLRIVNPFMGDKD